MSDTSPPGRAREAAGAAGADDPAEIATQVFVDHRELLFSMVYNMLGTVADTEDVLQETWLAWAARTGSPHAEPVEIPRAYLVRIAVNKALARQAAVSRLRETYVGPWLPEPLATGLVAGPGGAGPGGEGPGGDGAEVVERAESVSMALMVVLESLTSLERAVFVLHEVFGYAHTETAGILGRSPAAVRQLAHRAREHVQARRPRYRADPRVQQQVTERFAAAVHGGDLEALLRLLAPDVTLWADGGGKAPAAGLGPVHGRERIGRLLAVRGSRISGHLDIRYRQVNGGPSAVLFHQGSPFAVLVVDLEPDTSLVRDIYFVTNPDKLSHLD